MANKKKKTKGPSTKERIMSALTEHGPMYRDDLFDVVGGEERTVWKRARDLVNSNILYQQGEGKQTMYGLTGDKAKSTPLDEVLTDPPGGEKESETPPTPSTEDYLKQEFTKQLQIFGCSPKEGATTFANIFFNGDIRSMPWLEKVLTQDGAGFIPNRTQRLMMSWWSNSQGLSYDQPEVDEESTSKDSKDVREKTRKTSKKSKGSSIADLDIGWIIEKQPGIGWVPVPGGDLTYDEALDRCERRTALDSAARPYATAASSEEENRGVDKSKRRGDGGDEGNSLTNMILQKVIDNAFDNKRGEDPRVQALESTLKLQQQEIERMREEQMQARLDRIEGEIAQIASRETPEEAYYRLSRLQPVTSDSPSVKIITDASDKFDKGMTRFTGLIEQVFLKEAYKEESTRTPEQREAEAGRLLDRMGSEDRIRELGQRTFRKYR